MLIAVREAWVGKVHRGVELGGAARCRGIQVEGRLPRQGVRHWAREL